MLQIERKKQGLKITECYFFNSVEAINDKNKVDIAMIVQCKEPFQGAEEFDTILIDLKLSEEELFSNIKKNSRYEINRALREELWQYKMNVHPEYSDIELIVQMYNQFARTKGIREIGIEKLVAISSIGGLVISQCYSEHSVSVYHVYICDGIRARLLYSFRDVVNVSNIPSSHIGWANRLLHWEDIRQFKEMGYETYDFGGSGKMSKKLENIARFKSDFGGVDIIEYYGWVPKSIWGTFGILVFKGLEKVKRMRNAFR